MNGVVTASGETIEPFGRSLFERASERALSRVGVVDVGSNSIRMVVFDGAARSPAYFYNEKVMAGLGQGLASTGMLNPDGALRGMDGLCLGGAREPATEDHRGGFRHQHHLVPDLAAEQIGRRGLAATGASGQNDAAVAIPMSGVFAFHWRELATRLTLRQAVA